MSPGLKSSGLIALAFLTLSIFVSVHSQETPTLFLYVNDLTDPPTLLSSETDSIQELCLEVDQQTSAEVAILVVNSTQPLGIDMSAVKTFEENGIGKQGLDDGVLILVSTNERQWRIEVGYGLEGVLNDAKVGNIGRTTISPAFDSGTCTVESMMLLWQ